VVSSETVQRFKTLDWGIQVEVADALEWLRPPGPPI